MSNPVLRIDQVPAGRMIQTIYPKSFADEVSIFDFGMVRLADCVAQAVPLCSPLTAAAHAPQRPGPGLWPAPNCSTDPEKDPGNCPNATNPGRTHRFCEYRSPAAVLAICLI
jgi:hypothetical protein